MVFKKGYKQSEEHRKKIIKAIRLQHKINPSYGMKGKVHSDKTKDKMSQASIGKPKTELHKIHWMRSMNKLRKEGKLIAWNKGLTPRVGKYKSSTYKSHRVYYSVIGNHPYIPKGMVIHHIDFDSKNNNSSNLIMIDKSLHHKWHNQASLLLRK